jgi:hypothetical protein
MNRAGDRKVAKTGIAEKWLVGLPYLPFWIGLVARADIAACASERRDQGAISCSSGFWRTCCDPDHQHDPGVSETSPIRVSAAFFSVLSRRS